MQISICQIPDITETDVFYTIQIKQYNKFIFRQELCPLFSWQEFFLFFFFEYREKKPLQTLVSVPASFPSIKMDLDWLKKALQVL